MFRIYDGRSQFYQWDLNRKLIVRDATIQEVHFCNKTDSCALVCEVYTEGANRVVDVPNVLLQNVWRIRAYAYADNHTEYESYFDIKPRTKPADYIYTETEVKRYEDYESRLAALEEKEVDLTGYATEDFVTSAISDSAPDWNAHNIFQKGYINNRTHYTEKAIGITVNGELAEGTTKILDLTKAGYAQYIPYLNPEKQREKYCTYPLRFRYDYVTATTVMGMKVLLNAAKYIDNTTNIYYTLGGGFTVYVITDRNSLSDEQKAQFPTIGVYTHTDNKREGAKNWCANLTYELRKYTQKLDYGFMPAQFLEAADKEEILAAIPKQEPLLLDADSAESYLEDPTSGDAALAAIKAGKQILVKVPNADGGNYTVNYSPVYMYQVPNYENEYLYLFFLRDEKNTIDLSALGMGAFEMPVYGQLKMKLSQEYNSNPLV